MAMNSDTGVTVDGITEDNQNNFCAMLYSETIV